MSMQSPILLMVFLATLLALAYPLGIYLTKVGEGASIRGLSWMFKIEKILYRLAGINAQALMSWKSYTVALLVFNTVGALFVYAVQRLQSWLPLNPQAFPNVSPDSSFNTAVSFVTNTNWQGYKIGRAHV